MTTASTIKGPVTSGDGAFVGVIEAVSHPSRPAKRLLARAATWPDSLSDGPPPTTSYKTARQLRPAQVDKLVEEYLAGTTMRELARQFSVHRATVGKHLAARGVEAPPGLIPPEEVSTVVALYCDGWTLEQISQKFGTTRNTVRRRLQNAGVAMRR